MENQPQQFNPDPQVPLPNATAVLVLGIISIVGCFCYGLVGLVCGIIAVVLASKDLKLYNASPAAYTLSSYNNLKAGRVCGIIGLILSGIYVAVLVFYIVVIGTAILTNPQEIFHHMQ